MGQPLHAIRSTSNLATSVQRRITSTLFAAQSLFSASMTASFVLMPILATQLSGSASLAGLPSTLIMAGRAASAYPVGWLMDRRGRRLGLTLGYLFAALGGALSVFAIGQSAFALFCGGAVLAGMGRGVSEQARFAAAEVRPPTERARAISWIVFAGAVGAIGGPLLIGPSGSLAQQLGLGSDSGPYLLTALLMTVALLGTFLFLRPDPIQIARALEAQTDVANPTRPMPPMRSLRLIIRERDVILAVAAMVIGQLVMTLIMVITPLHMHGHDHGAQAISWVIMAHNLGMFGLSGLTGWLTEQLGRVAMIVLGAATLALSAVLTPIWLATPLLALVLFLLGLGWNFCFIAGSSLLTDALTPRERGQVQGINESLIALAASASSIGTGIIFARGGIITVSAFGLAFALGLVALTAWLFYRKQTATVGSAD